MAEVITPELQEALTLHRNGRLDEAARCYRNILAAEPHDFEALFYLGQVLAAQGRLEESFGLTHAASLARPDSAEAHYQMGTLLLAMRRPHQALPSLQRATQLQPRHARALNMLAMAWRAVDRFDQAELCLRAAIDADPTFAEAYRNLGTLLNVMERPEQARPMLERSIELQPADPVAHTALAALLRQLGRWEEALDRCGAAFELDPDFAEAYAVKGDVELELGRIDVAKSDFERALSLEPGSAAFLCRLVSIERTEPGSERLAQLEAFSKAGLYREERTRVAFALAKAYADVGERDRGFAQLLLANELQRATIDYEEAATFASLQLTERTFSREFVRAREDWGFPSQKPVFIVGMPRSGTTLIEQILASHPLVLAGGELPDFSMSAESVLSGEALGPIEATALQAAGPNELRQIGERYVKAISSLSAEAQRITDKMPANANYLGLIRLALPNAHIIHSKRDPVDTCLSCFSLLFSEGQAFTYDLGELGRYYRAYERLMQHWHDVLPSGTILDVNYEDVVDDLEGQARRIVDFCGLPWDDACLAFYETKRPVQTASVIQVRQPIYRTSVGKWRPAPDVLKPLYEGLGIEAPMP